MKEWRRSLMVEAMLLMPMPRIEDAPPSRVAAARWTSRSRRPAAAAPREKHRTQR